MKLLTKYFVRGAIACPPRSVCPINGGPTSVQSVLTFGSKCTISLPSLGREPISNVNLNVLFYMVPSRQEKGEKGRKQGQDRRASNEF